MRILDFLVKERKRRTVVGFSFNIRASKLCVGGQNHVTNFERKKIDLQEYLNLSFLIGTNLVGP